MDSFQMALWNWIEKNRNWCFIWLQHVIVPGEKCHSFPDTIGLFTDNPWLHTLTTATGFTDNVFGSSCILLTSIGLMTAIVVYAIKTNSRRLPLKQFYAWMHIVRAQDEISVRLVKHNTIEGTCRTTVVNILLWKNNFSVQLAGRYVEKWRGQSGALLLL